MMTSFEKSIYEKAQKLKDLEKEYLRITDKEYVRITYQSKSPPTRDEVAEYAKELWLIGAEAFHLRNDIAECFIENMNILVFNDSVKEILIKIREKKQFECIAFFELESKDLEEASETNKEILIKMREKFDFAIDFEQFLLAKCDEWFDDFYQRFHPLTYHLEIMAIGPILSSSKIPPRALVYFNEIREVYSLGLYLSAIALCRAVLEMCLFDKLSKKIPKNKSNELEKDVLQRLAIRAKKENLLNSKAKELADKIRVSANEIMHDKRSLNQISSQTKRDTFDIINNTVKVLEILYS